MSQITPVHQWVDAEGYVLWLRCDNLDGVSRNGFQWPRSGRVECPDWNPEPVCGGGLHGWPWGIGVGSGKDPVFVDAEWRVVRSKPEDVVLVGGEKIKARIGEVVYCGSWWRAYEIVAEGQREWIHHASMGAASATGGGGAASATGWRGIAAATGELATVEAGRDGVAVSTADECVWIARPGSVFIQSWRGGYVAVSALELGALDGEHIHWLRGEISKRQGGAR